MDQARHPPCAAKRTRSAPRMALSPRSPNEFYAFPATLLDILYGPRQQLTTYADGMRVLSRASPPPPLPPEAAIDEPTAERPAAAVAMPVQRKEVSDAHTKEEGGQEVQGGVERVIVLEESPVEKAVKDAPKTEEAIDGGAATEEVSAPAVTEDDKEKKEKEVTLVSLELQEDKAAAEAQEEGADATSAAAATETPVDAAPSESTDTEVELPVEMTEKAAEHAEKIEVQEEVGEVQGEKEGEEEQAADEEVEVKPVATPTENQDREKEKEEGEEVQHAVSEKPEASEHADVPQEPSDTTTTTTASAVASAGGAPALRSSSDVAIPFDPARSAAWMAEYRADTTHVPPGVNRFVRELEQLATKLSLRVASSPIAVATPLVPAAGKRGKKGASSTMSCGNGNSAMSPSGSTKGSLMASSPELTGRGAAFGAATAKKATNALEALGDVWEGRQETPISLTHGAMRRRGLFGEVEKKELHHMVIAVLNKVTTNLARFREVKNELLRLPIPEASPEQLTKIVGAFFSKAVREQHFSHSYADLIVALCKVPQGQHIIGDKTQSLEYRLRVALLKRCQSEFLQSLTSEPTEETAGETEKERRDRMCGNVRFVCELFLRDVVVGNVISFILRVCLLGSEFGEFVLPPTYTPTESQVDEVIAAVKTVKERFFLQNAEGRRMLPLVLGQLEYWMDHYPVSRCRFVLMSIVDDLHGLLPAPSAEASHSGLTIATSVNAECASTAASVPQDMPLVRSQVPQYGSMSAREVSDSVLAVTPAEGQQSTMVGGQPLPAPRSKQVGSTSVAESAVSVPAGAPLEPAAASPLLALVVTLSSRPLLQHVRPDAIAKLMGELASGQLPVDKVAGHLFDYYGNVLPAIAAWMDRGLSVAREEKARKQTGAVLASCASLLAAHLDPASEEWTQTTAACREQLHDVAMEALQRAIDGKLYEDLHIFQFWAQLVLSDHDRTFFDEEMLNEGLELVAYTAPVALRGYLVEVSKYLSTVLVSPEKLPWYAPTEAEQFVRFRPLLVLHSLAMQGGLDRVQEVLDDAVSFADVRQQSIEMRLYHAFRTGSTAHEALFEQLRSAPRLLSRDSTLAAEVLSAMLIAELTTEGLVVVENNLDLLQVTVDGVSRAAREMAVVAEVHEVLRYTPREMPMSAASRVLRKCVFMHILSEETMENANHIFLVEQEGQEGVHAEEAALVAPATTEAPRITDRRSPDEDMRSPSTSLRSANERAGHGSGSAEGMTAPASPPGGSMVPFSTGGGDGNGGRTGSIEAVLSSTASSLADFSPLTSNTRQQQHTNNLNNSSSFPHVGGHVSSNGSGQGQGSRRRRDSELSSRHSIRLNSPTHSHEGSTRASRGGDDASKRLYRNTYKNRRRSHGEGGSGLPSSAGGSKDVSPQHTPMMTHAQHELSLESSRNESSSTSRYDRRSRSPRGGRGGGGGSVSGDRGRGRGGGHSSSNSRTMGNSSNSGGGKGRGGGGAGQDDTRRSGGRYGSTSGAPRGRGHGRP